MQQNEKEKLKKTFLPRVWSVPHPWYTFFWVWCHHKSTEWKKKKRNSSHSFTRASEKERGFSLHLWCIVLEAPLNYYQQQSRSLAKTENYYGNFVVKTRKKPISNVYLMILYAQGPNLCCFSWNLAHLMMWSWLYHHQKCPQKGSVSEHSGRARAKKT